MLSDGAPEEIRTPDPQIRSLVLYPAELRARLAQRGSAVRGAAAAGRARREMAGAPRPCPCQGGLEPIAKARAKCRYIARPTRKAPVAQLDRAPDYESGGQEFESLRARQYNQ